MAFKMKSSPVKLLGGLAKAKRKAKKEQKKLYKEGKISKAQYKEDKKEIRKYTDY